MSIVNMRKLNLVAMSYDKDAILNALHRTNAAEVTLHEETENTAIPVGEQEGLVSRLSVTEAALFSLSSFVSQYEKDNNIKSDLLKDGFDVSYSEFVAAGSLYETVDGLVLHINELVDEKNRLKAELASIVKEKNSANIYRALSLPFDRFQDTAHTRGKLGTIPNSARDSLSAALDETELCAYHIFASDADNMLLYVLSHKDIAMETEGLLPTFGFAQCPYQGEKTGEELYNKLQEKERVLLDAIMQNEATMYALKEEIRTLKVYCDYLSFLIEKEDVSDKLRATKKTFLLQAYVPAPAEEQVAAELKETASAAYFEFTDPTEEEEPPTLLQNNSIVSSFEGITNTYSVPNYKEFDPNAVMAFFYSLFMGFIIGDAGYGLLMLLGGGYLWWKNLARPTGMSRLAGAFAVGGIFAVIWGLLFNSLFGLSILPVTVMPNPQTDMWTFVGISVPSVLIISMEIGVLQLFAGYICKAVQEWRRGNIADGICDGVIWSLFTLGVGVAMLGLTKEVGLPILTSIGGITAGGSLLLAVLTAGRKEKFFGKFTKGFGAAYGVINFASDILSYARLYGLMLSGAVIAQIIGTYGTQFLTSGNVLLIVLGVVILLIGHAFNLVMNLLGAYIHDARLQYVEFYGRFYEGNGSLFSPLGSKRKYISILPAEKKTV